MKKLKLKNMFMATAALSATVFALPQTAMAQRVDILGKTYQESTVLNLSGGGSIKWDKDNATLTLSNVTLNKVGEEDGDCFFWVGQPAMVQEIKVVLEGENTVNGSGYIFNWPDCNLTIQGSGSLTARTTTDRALEQRALSSSILTIKDCTLDIQGLKQSIIGGINGQNTAALSLVVDNATLKVKGAAGGWWKMSGIENLKAYELKNCHIETPGVRFGETSEGYGYQFLGEDNDTYYDEVSIVPDASTAISRPAAPATAAVQEIHSLDGRRQTRMRHGVNIVRMSDGTTRKVICRQ